MQRRAGDLVPAGPQATDRLADALTTVPAERSFADEATAIASDMAGLPGVGACVATLDGPRG